MKTYVLTAAAIAAFSVMVAGCGEKAPEAGYEELETQRQVTKENAKSAAVAWRADNPEFSSFRIRVLGDSTIGPKCPQGDGYSTVVLKSKDNQKQKLQCATYSAAEGCWMQEEFEARPALVSQKDKCNVKLPRNAKRWEG